MAKICPECGKQLKDTATFCGRCGKKLEADPGDKKPAAAKKQSPADAIGFIKANKKAFIGAGALLLAVVLILIIINPANSPKAVFNKYLDCLRSENTELLKEISYDANFLKEMTADDVAQNYQMRFSSADDSYKSGGKVNLLKGTTIKITQVSTPKQSEITTRRAALTDRYRNAARITDIRNITFEITRAGVEGKSIGTAEAICVTGKWYIGEVTGI